VWGGFDATAPWKQSRSGGKLGGKMNILNEKLDFLLTTNFLNYRVEYEF
jgi:hypothetical protein